MDIPLIFATRNSNKVMEARTLLGNPFRIMSLQELAIPVEIPEPYSTLEENAREKSMTIHRLTGKNCFGEDTGLETEALNGEPGVLSARYSGVSGSAVENIRLLLSRLEGKTNRRARFRTVISLIWQDREYSFTGICNGTIRTEEKGQSGFGYDPIFQPDLFSRTFAEMTLQEKNRCSHRAQAFNQLKTFLLAWPG
ncbi:MAG TPA: RdgB/HAM1 family non-canonical purine NTP pyrophosphatase [Chitinophagaceae bacterium]|nr:RdgB/HAM1 family non-canonical purine NTP pyrophosphatase [Chitinophagaceae bacterium]